MRRPTTADIIPWAIVLLLFIATALSFLDRQVLSFAVIRIKEDIHINDIDYSRINAAFIIGYAIIFPWVSATMLNHSLKLPDSWVSKQLW
jgi:hypothetical protein